MLHNDSNRAYATHSALPCCLPATHCARGRADRHCCQSPKTVTVMFTVTVSEYMVSRRPSSDCRAHDHMVISAAVSHCMKDVMAHTAGNVLSTVPTTFCMLYGHMCDPSQARNKIVSLIRQLCCMPICACLFPTSFMTYQDCAEPPVPNGQESKCFGVT